MTGAQCMTPGTAATDVDTKCQVCGNSVNNEILVVAELMNGSGESFRYLRCGQCQLLQLLDIPIDMSRYYGSRYYSFQKKTPETKVSGGVQWRRLAAMRRHLGYGTWVDAFLGMGKKICWPWLLHNLVRLEDKILDVGCGNGFLVREMAQYGFSHLVGVDPNLNVSKHTSTIWPRLLRTELDSLDESGFDFIMFHHSFEHVANPRQQLIAAKKRLTSNGTVLIRTPIANSYAFRKYGKYWVQWDAPRHYFVHTQMSIAALCADTGFTLKKVIFDSNGFQFAGSECYARGLSLNESGQIFDAAQAKYIQQEVERLNRVNDGDSACFYLIPT